MNPGLSLIVAMDRRGVIGREGRLPWRLSTDLRRFKQITMGHCLIMGRSTFASIGRALPGRTSIVLSRRRPTLPAGVLLATDFDEALRLCGDDPEPFVIGGAQIYQLALPRAEMIYLTRVEAEVAGDAFFPAVDWDQWRITLDLPHDRDANNEYPFRFQILKRKSLRPGQPRAAPSMS